jgi:transcriptional regulator with XRE-family HTH domain
MKAGPSPPGGILKIRQNVERLRGERGLTAATVAERSGIPYPSSWYRKMDRPGLFKGEEFQAIAETLGVEVAELFR